MEHTVVPEQCVRWRVVESPGIMHWEGLARGTWCDLGPVCLSAKGGRSILLKKRSATVFCPRKSFQPFWRAHHRSLSPLSGTF